ncbi:interferon alpha-inducible protein 27-like protein 2A [Heptranchias perlo]|uniref:interferon alpha-inducible protein 27-like protein 2A n=1 Tax=Heptranchias perlo TaxID=212740 RepID=UPI00355A6B41
MRGVTEFDHNLIWTISFGLWRKIKMHCLALLILVCCFFAVDASPCSKAVLMAMGASFAIFAAQNFIATLGFTATGIAADTWAAKLMSIVAYLNGGIVPPGSFVATLQSIGTAGFSTSTKLMLGVIGAISSILISVKLDIF